VSSRIKHIVVTLGALAACLLVFELTPADVWLQEALYDESTHSWLLSGARPLVRFVFYDGPKGVLILFAASLALALLLHRRIPALASHRSGMRIVLVSLLLVPASVATLKQTNTIGCPNDLALFGGQVAYAGMVRGFFANGLAPVAHRRCFPAAHASGGFALLSLCFLFKQRRHRARAVCLALAAGWAMGGYKMLIGDHFLSHTIIAMLLAWLIVNAVVIAERRTFGRPRYAAPESVVCRVRLERSARNRHTASPSV
jgi:membrane-associated PAP2 superfamily phosphatase